MSQRWIRSIVPLFLIALVSGSVCPSGCLDYVEFTKTDLVPAGGPTVDPEVTIVFTGVEAKTGSVDYDAYFQLEQFLVAGGGWVRVDIDPIMNMGEFEDNGECWVRTIELTFPNVPLSAGLNDFRVGASAHPLSYPPYPETVYWGVSYTH